MAFTLSHRSLSNLKQCHPQLCIVVTRAIQISQVDFIVGAGIRSMEEQRENVRLALAFALLSSGQSAYMEQLVMALDSRRDYQAETYLFELGKYDGKLADMYPYLRSPRPEIRAKLVRVLGEIGEAEAQPYIQPLTEDPNMDVMEEAVEALRNLNPNGL